MQGKIEVRDDDVISIFNLSEGKRGILKARVLQKKTGGSGRNGLPK